MASKLTRLAQFVTVFVLVFMAVPDASASRGAPAVPAPAGPLTTANFAFNVQGAQLSVDNESLASYQSWLASWNVSNPTGYLHHQTTDFLFLQYCWNHACTNDSQSYVLINVEVYQFANATAASNEFKAQYPYKSNGGCAGTVCPPGSPTDTPGPILLRFVQWNPGHTSYTLYATQQLIQRSNFMFFLYTIGPGLTRPGTSQVQTMFNFTNAYINDIFDIIPEDVEPTPAPAVPAGSPAWGLQVGDNITWNVQSTTVVGDVLSGGTTSTARYDVNMQVVQVADGGSAIEVKGPAQYGWPSDFNEGGSFNTYGSIHPGPLPNQCYTWVYGTAPYMDPRGSGLPLLYPNFRTLQALESSMNSSTVATGFAYDTQYVTGTYSTPYYGTKLTPIETENERLVEHLGSGVVTTLSFYYNNNQNAVTKSAAIALKGASFDLASRLPLAEILTTTSTATSSAPTTSNSAPPPQDYTVYIGVAAGVVAAVAVVAVAFLLRRRT